MKFGLLIEYNKTTTFLEKPYTKCGVGTISRPFSVNSEKFLYSSFLLYAKLRDIGIYWTEVVEHLILPHKKLSNK